MYKTCFDQMGLGAEQLSSFLDPLYGFTGDAIVPIGQISLPLTIGGTDRHATTLTDFLIVDCPSTYNIVFGRPTRNDLDLITSTRSLTVKFPTPNGVGCVRGEQHLVRRCYENVIKMGAKGKKVNVIPKSDPRPVSQKGVSHNLDPREVDCHRHTGPVEELEDILVREADEERRLKLGKNLTLEVKSQLTDFLRANLDVFAWNHGTWSG